MLAIIAASIPAGFALVLAIGLGMAKGKNDDLPKAETRRMLGLIAAAAALALVMARYA